jgi:hypothetical protein
MREHTVLIELMFACYKAGEIRGKMLNHTILADPKEQLRDFKSLCASEIRMAEAYVDLSTLGPLPEREVMIRIQDEADACGLTDILWHAFEQENKP